MVEELSLSTISVRNITKYYLGMCSIKLQKTHIRYSFEGDQISEELPIAKPVRHFEIIFIDEKLFIIELCFNLQNKKILVYRLKQRMDLVVISNHNDHSAFSMTWTRMTLTDLVSGTRMSRSTARTTQTTFTWKKCYPGASPISMDAHELSNRILRLLTSPKSSSIAAKSISRLITEFELSRLFCVVGPLEKSLCYSSQNFSDPEAHTSEDWRRNRWRLPAWHSASISNESEGLCES